MAAVQSVPHDIEQPAVTAEAPAAPSNDVGRAVEVVPDIEQPAPPAASTEANPTQPPSVAPTPVVMQQAPAAGGATGREVAVAAGKPAEEPLLAAIFACLCCCWCTGLMAIFKAQEVAQANREGNYGLAQQKHKEAMHWIAGTIIAGVVGGLVVAASYM